MSADEKIGLATMIFERELEVEDIDIWQSVYGAEGKCLPPNMARRRDIARKTVETLRLLQEHREGFVALVAKQRRANEEDSSSTRSSKLRSTGS